MTANNNPVQDVARENLTLSALLDLNLTLGSAAARKVVKDVVVSAPEDLMTDQRQQVWRVARDIAVAGGVPTLADVRRRPDLRAVPDEVWAAIEAASAEAFGIDLGENVAQLVATSQRRRMYQLGQQLIMASRAGEDLSGAVAEATRALGGVMSGKRGRTKGAGEFGGAQARSRAERVGLVKAVYTGIKRLDLRCGGGRLENGEVGPGLLVGKLTTVVAKSGDGKSAMVQNLVLENARHGIRSLYLSGEMGSISLPKLDDHGKVVVDEDGVIVEQESHDIFDRLEMLAAGVRSHGAGSKVSPESDQALAEAHAWLTESDVIRVYDDEFSVSTIESLAEECRAEGRDIMVIDNLTHIARPAAGRNGEEAEHQWYKNVCERLQTIAKNTGVAIVACVQASITDRVAAGAAPRETELGASRGISHASSYVITLGRDADKAAEGDVTDAEIRIVKVRYPRRGGRKCLIRGYWRSSTGTWVSDLDLEPGEQPVESERESILEQEERKLRTAEEKKRIRSLAKETAKAKIEREKQEAQAAQEAADREAEEALERENLWERADRQAGGAQ